MVSGQVWIWPCLRRNLQRSRARTPRIGDHNQMAGILVSPNLFLALILERTSNIYVRTFVKVCIPSTFCSQPFLWRCNLLPGSSWTLVVDNLFSHNQLILRKSFFAIDVLISLFYPPGSLRDLVLRLRHSMPTIFTDHLLFFAYAKQKWVWENVTRSLFGWMLLLPPHFSSFAYRGNTQWWVSEGITDSFCA